MYNFYKLYNSGGKTKTSRPSYSINDPSIPSPPTPSNHPPQALRSRVAEGASATPPPLPPQSYLLMRPLNVLFLKEVIKNVHENQQAKSRAS